jgi:exosortase
MNTVLDKQLVLLSRGSQAKKFLLQWSWLGLGVLLVYGGIVFGMAGAWWTNEDYAHGLFTPFAIAYLVYERRRELVGISGKPSDVGLFIILASQVILAVGFLGAEFFLQRVSILVFIAGLIVYLWGWRALWRTAFALILILLAIPLPAIIFNSFALPLQLLASTSAEGVLDMMHISVLREGNILNLPHGVQLNVAEACSGIRSLVSLIALTALVTMLARFRRIPWWARFIFILSSIPIALLANAFRVAGTALLAYQFGESAAEGFFHSLSGALVFVIAFAALLVEIFFFQSLALPRKDVAA